MYTMKGSWDVIRGSSRPRLGGGGDSEIIVPVPDVCQKISAGFDTETVMEKIRKIINKQKV